MLSEQPYWSCEWNKYEYDQWYDQAFLSYDPAVLQMKDLVYKNTRLSIAYMVKHDEPPVMPVDSLIKREN